MAGLFGKRLNPPEDERTLKMRDYLAPSLPMPPVSRTYDKGITAWGVMLNDRLGCCTCSAAGHAIQETSANVGSEITVPDSAVLTAYEAVSGYNPQTGQNDNGAYEIDVLRYWQGTGVGGHKNAAYAACSTTNLDDVKACVNLFGFCYIGFVVPSNCIQQFDAGQPWDDSGSPTTDGHAVIVVDFDATGGTVVTWGRLQKFTWAWWGKFVDEAWGVVLPDWIAANGQAPSGFNLQQLLADVNELQQTPTPTPQPTTVTLTASPQSLTLGQTVQLAATVAGQQPQGTVTFSMSPGTGQPLSLTQQLAGGQASQPWQPPAAGTWTCTASYSGNVGNAPSSSQPVSVTVTAAWKPDANVTRWLTWQKQVADYVADAYAGGDVADTQTWQRTLAQYEPDIAYAVAGQPHNLPAAVPEGPHA